MPVSKSVAPLEHPQCGEAHYMVTLRDTSMLVLCKSCAHRAVMRDARLVRAELLPDHLEPLGCERCHTWGMRGQDAEMQSVSVKPFRGVHERA